MHLDAHQAAHSVLGTSAFDDMSVVKRRFQTLVGINHPDRCPIGTAAAATADITNAWNWIQGKLGRAPQYSGATIYRSKDELAVAVADWNNGGRDRWEAEQAANEEARRQANEEARRQAEEARRQAEEARKAWARRQEEARRAEEARKAAEEAEYRRQAEEKVNQKTRRSGFAADLYNYLLSRFGAYDSVGFSVEFVAFDLNVTEKQVRGAIDSLRKRGHRIESEGRGFFRIYR